MAAPPPAVSPDVILTSGFAEHALFALVTAVVSVAMTLVVVMFTSWLQRRTDLSKSVFEHRLDALNHIWQAFNEMTAIFVRRTSLGFPVWNGKYGEAADQALKEYRRAVDNSQVVLDAQVVKVLRDIDEAYDLFLGDEKAHHSDIQTQVRPLLAQLTDVVNSTMSKRTHLISLAQFRT